MVGNGTIFARADASDEVVSVYEIDAEDGSQEELSIYGSLVWTDTFDSVLRKRGAPAAVPSD
ncbi:hypothetical protein GCM10007209_37590 [Haloferax sulfurifontis]|uniref:Uncharacterized protein n=3 Tax=Haloferax sulfurifontis TaxID=255616 RepID=M0III5_9EURY|nr:hypothetical protein C441_04284 [Haloferax sulfurifontis ATCC BAA-897]GGC72162.1 hypothetical protein GCM10007209_37590 [Haloferax sulfurifontis]